VFNFNFKFVRLSVKNFATSNWVSRFILILTMMAAGSAYAQSTLKPILIREELGEAYDRGLITDTTRLAVLTIQDNIRIEKIKDPKTHRDAIRLIIPLASCDSMPIYYLYKDESLFFFQDESKRKVTIDVGCFIYEARLVLNPTLLEAAEEGYQRPGLLIPRAFGHPFIDDDFEDAVIRTSVEGSFNLSLDRNGDRIQRAELTMSNAQGMFTRMIQELP
jgi:hypothetical protein